MTELLSKEKEFLKLNEQLNRMASTAMEPQPMQNSSEIARPISSNSSQPKNEARFLTFQKSKGQSTLLRKQRGAGDGPSELMDLVNRTTTTTTVKERLNLTMGSNTYRQGNKHSNENSTSPRITVTAATPTPPTTALGHYSSTTKPNHTSTVPQQRKPLQQQPKGNETYRAHNQNRFSNSRVPPTNTSTFTIKYHNPKFVKSPSLEILARDECSTMRSQKSSMDSKHFDSSASSVAHDSELLSTGRRSQASNLTIGSKKNVSTDGLIKFLKSKVTILEDDHSRLSQEMTKQKELLEKALDQVKAMEQQRDQAYAKNNALKEQLTKIETQLEDASQCNKERSKEQLKQQKELETFKREMKILTQNNKNLEKRLYRANEELENSRTSLSQMKKTEKELREETRVDLEAKDKQIKNLKKQRADLLNAYKKQLFLIDNLKRQTICMEQAKMIAFGEKEFSKVLDWDMKS